MNRRQFLLNTFRMAGMTGLALLGIPILEAKSIANQAAMMTATQVGGGGGGGTGCTLQTPGDIMNEGFLGANDGYDNTGWTATTGSGGSVDSDFSPLDDDHSAYDADWCNGDGPKTEGLKVIVGAGYETYTSWDRGSTLDRNQDIDVVIYIDLKSVTLDASSYAPLLRWATNTIRLYNDAGTYKVYGAGADAQSSMYAISLNTWHVITLHLDATAANSYMDIDGTGSTDTFTRQSTDGQVLDIGPYTNISGSEAMTFEVGFVYIDTP